MRLAINEVLRKPSLLTTADDVVYLRDKRKDEVKSVLIPARFLSVLQSALDEIEYQLWQERNAKALAAGAQADFVQVESAAADVGHQS